MGLTIPPSVVDRFFDRVRDALPVHVPRRPSLHAAVGLLVVLVVLLAPAIRDRIHKAATRRDRYMEIAGAIALLTGAVLLSMEVRQRLYHYQMFTANLRHFTLLRWIPLYMSALRTGHGLLG